MRIVSFIELDEKVRKGKREYSVTGEVYIPINTVVPVILKGTGCIGTAIVEEICMRSESTRITFLFDPDISEQSKAAYYALYRNQVTNTEDPYDNQDVFIPGAMGSTGASRGNASDRIRELDSDRRRERDDYTSRSSLSDFLDDY